MKEARQIDKEPRIRNTLKKEQQLFIINKSEYSPSYKDF